MKESNFIKKMYLLSNNIEMLIFFDRIKYVFSKWIDEYLEGIEYELELIENVNQYNTSWISINMGLNRQTDTFEKNEQLNDIEKWNKFAEKFQNKFDSIDSKRLKIDIEGDINIFNH